MPAAKPAFDAALDSGNALTTGAEWATWAVTDPANPTRLTDVSGNALHGALTNLAPASTLTVTGGTLAGAYTPNGAYGGHTKWEQDSGDGILAYSGMGMQWALYASQMDLDMDMASYSGSDTTAPWDATWSGITVAEGTAVPGPWFADGLGLTASPGYVTVTPDASLQPGTNDFSIVLHYTYTNTASEGQATVLFHWYGGGKSIMLYRWPDDGSNWGNSGLRLSINDGTATATVDFITSRTAWTVNQENIVVIACDRSGNATCRVNGASCGSGSISATSGSLTGMTTLLLGTRSELYPSWSFQGRLHTGLIYPARLLSSTEADAIAADINDLAAASGPEAQSATAGYAASTGAAYAPTATAGPLTVTAGFAASSGAAYDATATTGAVTAEAGFADTTGQAFDATATVDSSQNAEAGFAASDGQAFDAEATPGAITATAGFASSDGAAYDARVVAGILRVTTTGTDVAWFDIQPEGGIADNAVGNVAMARLKVVDTSSCGLNQGPNLTICDERFQFTVHLREDALNLDGQAAVAVTLDDAPHWVTLEAKGEACTVSVDGRVLATGPPAGSTTKKAITFGTHVSEAAI